MKEFVIMVEEETEVRNDEQYQMYVHGTNIPRLEFLLFGNSGHYGIIIVMDF